ncbi:hypothetical protein BJ742DRAFT_791938 [Cladochytrium replicatum]|nr:hypothetical protein BJ742DRAFT_791938 [Cladochytrium replicatum]
MDPVPHASDDIEHHDQTDEEKRFTLWVEAKWSKQLREKYLGVIRDAGYYELAEWERMDEPKFERLMSHCNITLGYYDQLHRHWTMLRSEYLAQLDSTLLFTLPNFLSAMTSVKPTSQQNQHAFSGCTIPPSPALSNATFAAAAAAAAGTPPLGAAAAAVAAAQYARTLHLPTFAALSPHFNPPRQPNNTQSPQLHQQQQHPSHSNINTQHVPTEEDSPRSTSPQSTTGSKSLRISQRLLLARTGSEEIISQAQDPPSSISRPSQDPSVPSLSQFSTPSFHLGSSLAFVTPPSVVGGAMGVTLPILGGGPQMNLLGHELTAPSPSPGVAETTSIAPLMDSGPVTVGEKEKFDGLLTKILSELGVENPNAPYTILPDRHRIWCAACREILRLNYKLSARNFATHVKSKAHQAAAAQFRTLSNPERISLEEGWMAHIEMDPDERPLPRRARGALKRGGVHLYSAEQVGALSDSGRTPVGTKRRRTDGGEGSDDEDTLDGSGRGTSVQEDQDDGEED